MGEPTEFEPGQHAPNDGHYIEIGENSAYRTGVNNPMHIEMLKGQKFPETSNHNRKWKRAKLKH